MKLSLLLILATVAIATPVPSHPPGRDLYDQTLLNKFKFEGPHGQHRGPAQPHGHGPVFAPQVRPPSPGPQVHHNPGELARQQPQANYVPQPNAQAPPRQESPDAERVAQKKFADKGFAQKRYKKRIGHHKSALYWETAIGPNEKALLHAQLASKHLPESSYWSNKVNEHTQAHATALEQVRLHTMGSNEFGDNVWTKETPQPAKKNAGDSIKKAQETINDAKRVHGLSDEEVANRVQEDPTAFVPFKPGAGRSA